MYQVNRLIDRLDEQLCAAGVLKVASWKLVQNHAAPKLYAGRLSRGQPQFRTHIGLTPFAPSTRNIPHDVTKPLPLGDNSVDVFQAEDVFEHLRYDDVFAVIDEIHRVLRPGGLFRLSVPDYRCDVYERRSSKDEAGKIVFDPGGGGKYIDGRVEDGGHLWFPIFESVKLLFDRTAFAKSGRVEFRHYTAADGERVLRPIDYSLGYVQRTPDHDPRVTGNPRPFSIVVDAYKNAVSAQSDVVGRSSHALQTEE